MNAAQQFVALLMHGKLQGGRDYRAEHAYRATPPRLAANIRSTTVGGETFRMTRGERKRLRRVAHVAAVAAAHGYCEIRDPCGEEAA